VFLAKPKDGDYHQEMNSVVFLEWFENQLMPALKNPSLVVLDTVCPNFSHKKAVLKNYLTQHNIPFSATDTKKSII
jgi:transposase